MKLRTELVAGLKRLKDCYNELSLQKIKSYIKSELKPLLQSILQKCKNLDKTNFELGLYHYRHDNKSDAILRFKMAKFFNPDLVECLYYLGRCYYEMFKYDRARRYLDDYLNSKHTEFLEEARYCINLLENHPDKIKQIPHSILKSRFDRLAIAYASGSKQYDTGPSQRAFAKVVQLLSARNKPFGNSMLDLGCGIGLLGKLARLQKIANHVVAVEISPEMADIASGITHDSINIYDSVDAVDCISYLQEHEAKAFDVITALDLITYMPDVAALMAAAHKTAREGALFVLSFRESDKGVSFKVLTEQFIFSAENIYSIAKDNNWSVLQEGEATFQNGEKGKLLILERL